jgi:hypothetical protein
MDYRDINSKAIKNWYYLPLITQALNLSGKTPTYTTHDVLGGYNLLRVNDLDEDKSAFTRRCGM